MHPLDRSGGVLMVPILACSVLTLVFVLERITNHLRKYLRVLNAVATVCPLLGLLGTVMGMIEAFQSIAANMALGRPELLAEGISKALVTTAAGLSVAIPALIAYLYFVSRVDRLVMEMDALGQEVVELVAGDASRQPARSAAKRKARAA